MRPATKKAGKLLKRTTPLFINVAARQTGFDPFYTDCIIIVSRGNPEIDKAYFIMKRKAMSRLQNVTD